MSGEDTAAFLREARTLVALSWTQHADARTRARSPTAPWNPDAVSWSLLGALTAIYAGRQKVDSAPTALETLAHACVLLADILDIDSLSGWNDDPDRTQIDVLAALDSAAESAA